MTTHDASADANGFVRFFRNYTKTWIHAVATAGLTAFGTLTIVHRWFAALAIASYLVPPIALYLRHGRARPREDSASVADSSDGSSSSSGDERESGSVAESGQSGESEHAGARASAQETTTNESTANTPDAAADASSSETAGTEPNTTVERRSTAGSGGDEAGGAALEHADSVNGDAAEPARSDAAVDEEPTEAGTTRDQSTVDESTGASAETQPEWNAVDVPTDATLRDATVSSSGGYAVGDGGTVLADSGNGESGGNGESADTGGNGKSADTGGNGENGDGDEWRVLLEDGPTAGGNDLRGVDTTSDGGAVWVAGDSGSLGRIDDETGRHVDYTAPDDITDNWLGVAVAGESGAETILLINGSGAVLRGRYRGDALEWTGPEKPGSGSSLSGVALLEDGVGYCCDTNDGVFETTDGGESFERVGLEGADGTLTDVATTGEGECLVAADDGVVHRYDGPTWTPERVADRAASGIARHDERVTVCTDDAVYERAGPTGDWERFDVDASGPLLGVSIDGARGVAVGENGTFVERS
ncbi:hypothetical protein [Natronorubrum texcoconense]|uniref:Photosynthesis system II assembly factor Ycf48/Hcf136-like domain-containing protein n=1 Tax=Natronorubrum texcoconense TaxID=1095776 RepID=A0A1G9ER12_9EURY|nr:hypothetical protein [Natronorubrum texcoconense]SDK78534.1 hypothetical protein SAMN04515672_3942 [Natronorubrum texcoconense]